jgi:hypothetical protein
VCESGLVGLDPPDNRVPEFVAPDPKLWDEPPGRGKPCICFYLNSRGLLLPCILGLPCMDINRSIVGHSPLSESA